MPKYNLEYQMIPNHMHKEPLGWPNEMIAAVSHRHLAVYANEPCSQYPHTNQKCILGDQKHAIPTNAMRIEADVILCPFQSCVNTEFNVICSWVDSKALYIDRFDYVEYV